MNFKNNPIEHEKWAKENGYEISEDMEPYDPNNPEHNDVEKYIIYPGGVLIHTMFVMEAAAKIAREHKLSSEDKMILMIAALGHDMGKAVKREGKEDFITQREQIKSVERITSKGHEAASVSLVDSFMGNIGFEKNRGGPTKGGNLIFNKVKNLVGNHMRHIDYVNNKKDIAHFAEDIFPATIEELERIILSDMGGRPPLPGDMPEPGVKMIEDAKNRGVYRDILPSVFSGGDILPLFPPKERKRLADIENYIREKQLSSKVNSKEEAINAALEYLRKDIQIIDGNFLIEELGIEPGIIIKKILFLVWEKQKQLVIEAMGNSLKKYESDRQLDPQAQLSIIDPKEVYTLDQAIQDIKNSGFLPEYSEQGSPDSDTEIIKNSNKKRVISKMSENQVHFYHKLARELEKKLPEVIPFNELKNILNSKSFAVSRDEIYWSGIMDWIEIMIDNGHKKTTKEHVIDRINEFGILIEEYVDMTEEPELEKDLSWPYWDSMYENVDYDYAEEQIPYQFYKDYYDEFITWEFGDDTEAIEEWNKKSDDEKKEDVLEWGESEGYYRDYYNETITDYTTYESEEANYGYRAVMEADDRWGGDFTLFDPDGNVIETNLRSKDAVEYSAEEHARENYGEFKKRNEYETYSLKGGDNYTELLFRWGEGSFGKIGYDGNPHWEHDDVIAHMRYDERTDASGNDIIFIQEIQSDWHQEGREVGYSDYNKYKKELSRIKNKILYVIEKNLNLLKKYNASIGSWTVNIYGLSHYYESAKDNTYPIDNIVDLIQSGDYESAAKEWWRTITTGNNGEGMHGQAPASFESAILVTLVKIELGPYIWQEFEKIKEETENSRFSESPPAAPLSDTKDWASFAIKKSIQKAVEQGKDGIAWTTGEIQNKRYNFSEMVDDIYLVYNGEGDDSEYVRVVTIKNGAIGINEEVKNNESEIKRLIGHELYARIMSRELHPAESNMNIPTNGLPYRLLEGPIELDSQGMTSFYDKILRQIAGKIGKRFGAKPTTTVIYEGANPPLKIVPIEKEGKIVYQIIRTSPEDPALLAEKDNIKDAQNFVFKVSLKDFNWNRTRNNPRPHLVHYLPIPDAMRKDLIESGLSYYGSKNKITKIASGVPITQSMVNAVEEVLYEIDAMLPEEIDEDIYSELAHQFFSKKTINGEIGGDKVSRFIIFTGFYDEDGDHAFYDEEDGWIFINFNSILNIKNSGYDFANSEFQKLIIHELVHAFDPKVINDIADVRQRSRNIGKIENEEEMFDTYYTLPHEMDAIFTENAYNKIKKYKTLGLSLPEALTDLQRFAATKTDLNEFEKSILKQGYWQQYIIYLYKSIERSYDNLKIEPYSPAPKTSNSWYRAIKTAVITEPYDIENIKEQFSRELEDYICKDIGERYPDMAEKLIGYYKNIDLTKINTSKEWNRFLRVLGGGRFGFSIESMIGRDIMTNFASWSILDESAIDEIVSFSQGETIIDYMAGSGYTAYLLQKAGANVIAYDLPYKEDGHNYTTNKRKNWYKINEGDITKQVVPSGVTILLSWVPYEEDIANHILDQMDIGQKLIVIGEGKGGCTGDDCFHEKLYTNFKLIKKVDIPQWSGMHDAVFLYIKTNNDSLKDIQADKKNMIKQAQAESVPTVPTPTIHPKYKNDGSLYGYILRGVYRGESFTSFAYINEVVNGEPSLSALQKFVEKFEEVKNKKDYVEQGGDLPAQKSKSEEGAVQQELDFDSHERRHDNNYIDWPAMRYSKFSNIIKSANKFDYPLIEFDDWQWDEAAEAYNVLSSGDLENEAEYTGAQMKEMVLHGWNSHELKRENFTEGEPLRMALDYAVLPDANLKEMFKQLHGESVEDIEEDDYIDEDYRLAAALENYENNIFRDIESSYPEGNGLLGTNWLLPNGVPISFGGIGRVADHNEISEIIDPYIERLGLKIPNDTKFIATALGIVRIVPEAPAIDIDQPLTYQQKRWLLENIENYMFSRSKEGLSIEYMNQSFWFNDWDDFNYDRNMKSVFGSSKNITKTAIVDKELKFDKMYSPENKDEILRILNDAKLYENYNTIYSAPYAIKDVLFGGRGTLIFAIDEYALESGYKYTLIESYAVEFNGDLYDSTGIISENDLIRNPDKEIIMTENDLRERGIDPRQALDDQEYLVGLAIAKDKLNYTIKSIEENEEFNQLFIPKNVEEAFEDLALQQRADPEIIMNKITDKTIAPIYGFLLEHVGDLSNRIANKPNYLRGGYEMVKWKVEHSFPKIEKILYHDALETHIMATALYRTSKMEKYKEDFEERTFFDLVDLKEKMGDHPLYSQFVKDVVDLYNQLKKELIELGKEYAAAHAKLEVYNQAQQTARDAAVAIGIMDFKKAEHLLGLLNAVLELGPLAWAKYALEYDESKFAINKNWYKKVGSISSEEWDEMSEGYFDIGHQDFDDYGNEPVEDFDNKLWIWNGSRLKIKETNGESHAMAFDEYRSMPDSYWKGRYDDEKKIVSIVPPERLLNSVRMVTGVKIPSILISELKSAFPNADFRGFFTEQFSDKEYSYFASNKNWYKKAMAFSDWWNGPDENSFVIDPLNDIYVHFTSRENAEKIVEKGVLDSRDFHGVDKTTNFAVSGEYGVPDLNRQIFDQWTNKEYYNNYENYEGMGYDAAQRKIMEDKQIVALIFMTDIAPDQPQKGQHMGRVNSSKEVRWERPVPILEYEIVSAEKGIEILKNTNLPEEYEEGSAFRMSYDTEPPYDYAQQEIPNILLKKLVNIVNDYGFYFKKNQYMRPPHKIVQDEMRKGNLVLDDVKYIVDTFEKYKGKNGFVSFLRRDENGDWTTSYSSWLAFVQKVHEADNHMQKISSKNSISKKAQSENENIFNSKSGLGSVIDNRHVDYLGFVRYMTPNEFLSLVPPPHEFDEKSMRLIEEAIKSGQGIGNPYLSGVYDFETNTFQINNHEGRHRMTYLKNINPDIKVPVHIFLDKKLKRHDLDREQVDVDSIKLLPQK